MPPKKIKEIETDFASFYERILKVHHKNYLLSKDAIIFLNNLLSGFINDFCHCLVIIIQYARKKIISSREITYVVDLIFIENLQKHALSQSTKAATRFSAVGTKTKDLDKLKLIIPPNLIKLKVKPIVSEYNTEAKINDGACVSLAAVIEYLLAEILELAGNCAKANKNNTISTNDIKKAIKNDDELKRTLCRLKICNF